MTTSNADAAGEPFRCHCGNLLARLVAGGVEIKCRRCKRRIVIPLHGNPSSVQEPQSPGRQSKRSN